MADTNLHVLDGTGTDKYEKAYGAGTNGDPNIVEHSIDTTHGLGALLAASPSVSGSVIVLGTSLISGSTNVVNFPDTQKISGSVKLVGTSSVSVSGSVSVQQNVVADPLNSNSGSTLGAGNTYSGSAASTLGVAGIQVSLFMDQNGIVYVDQSSDGSSWDIIDPYNYYTSVGNFGITVQAVNSYYRVRVKNVGIVPTTIFRLQSCLCPVVEAIPRSLSANENLEVAIEEFYDQFGFITDNTPTNEMRVVVPYRLVGTTFSDSIVDPNFWTAGSGLGTVTGSGAQVILSSGSPTNGANTLQSVRAARYVAGSSQRCRMVMRLGDTGGVANDRRWGAFTTTDGAFFQLHNTSLGIVTRKTGVDTAVYSGSFNGLLGKAIAVPTTVKTWEIYWTNSKVWFAMNNVLLHTVAADSTTWVDTMHLPIRFEDMSSGSVSTNLAMNVRVASIHRLGGGLTQPTSYYFANGQTAGVQLKSGPGNIKSLIVNAVTNNAVITLSDSTSGATPIITAHTASNTTTTPFSIDFGGAPFFTGLRLIVEAANASVSVIYE